MNLLRNILHVQRGISVTVPALRGIATALLLMASLIPVRLMLGMDSVVESALIGSVCAAMMLFFVVQKRWKPHYWQMTGLMLMAGVWCRMIPSLLQWSAHQMSAISVERMATCSSAIALLFSVCLLCLLPVVLAACFVAKYSQQAGKRSLFLFGISFCLTLLLALSWIFQTTSLGAVALIAIICSLMACALQYFQKPVAVTSPQGVAQPVLKSDSGWMKSGVVLITGAAIAVCYSVAVQLVPQTFVSESSVFAGLVAGIVLGIVFRMWKSRTTVFSPLHDCLLLVLNLMIIVMAYPMLVNQVLWMQSKVSGELNHLLLRGVITGSLMNVPGFVLGRVLTHSTNASSKTFLFQTFGMAGVFVLVRQLSITHQQAALGVIVCAVILAAIELGRVGFRSGSPRWATGMATAFAVCTVTALLTTNRLNVAHSEKVLFSPNTLFAARSGVPRDQLASLDEGRVVAEFNTLSSRVSVWKYRGSQLLTRQNGISTEVRSTNPGYCPHNAGDLLPALIPLAMHPQAGDVLILGMHSPSLEVCQSWPLLSVSMMEGDSNVFEMLKWGKEHRPEWFSTLGLDQVETYQVSANLGMLSKHKRQYDVILSPHAAPIAESATSQMTQEFYQRVREQLNPQGFYCQRIAYHDLGPAVVGRVLQTLSDVFHQVQLIETTPGELLLIATDSEADLVTIDIVEKLKTPQAQRLMAQAGWDWSILLSRGSLSKNEIQKAYQDSVTAYSIADGRVACQLPLEIFRWGGKSESTRNTLAKTGQTLVQFIPETPFTETMLQEVSQRLEDVRLALQIQSEHPDDPWAYRAALRKQLQQRPRNTLQPVKHELKRVLHPEDRRRKDYLKSLGTVAKIPELTQQDLQQVARFQEPFDPLVTLFVHHEMNQLAKRLNGDDHKLRFQHLMHTVYYGSADDRSVRNASEVLNLVSKTPEMVPDPLDRWDTMNGLLQVMELRWQMRFNDPVAVKYEPSDTEQSIHAVEVALQEMDEIHQAYGQETSDWKTRKAFLQRTLLRPLREHRSTQLARYSLAPR